MSETTKLQRLIQLLSKGWVSPQDALHHCGLMSLSQRIGTLRRRGMAIDDKWVEDSEGRKAFKAYRVTPSARLAKTARGG
jgi:predicted DNA-binding ArsR family transcriptional regulator